MVLSSERDVKPAAIVMSISESGTGNV